MAEVRLDGLHSWSARNSIRMGKTGYTRRRGDRRCDHDHVLPRPRPFRWCMPLSGEGDAFLHKGDLVVSEAVEVANELIETTLTGCGFPLELRSLSGHVG